MQGDLWRWMKLKHPSSSTATFELEYWFGSFLLDGEYWSFGEVSIDKSFHHKHICTVMLPHQSKGLNVAAANARMMSSSLLESQAARSSGFHPRRYRDIFTFPINPNGGLRLTGSLLRGIKSPNVGRNGFGYKRE